jgi:hypothetical protein
MRRFLLSASAFAFVAACMLPSIAATPDAAIVPQDGMPVALDACKVTAEYGSANPDHFKTSATYSSTFHFSTDFHNTSPKDITELSIAFLIQGQMGYTRLIDRITTAYVAGASDKNVTGIVEIPRHFDLKKAWCTLGRVVFADGTEWMSSPTAFQSIIAPPAAK